MRYTFLTTPYFNLYVSKYAAESASAGQPLASSANAAAATTNPAVDDMSSLLAAFSALNSNNLANQAAQLMQQQARLVPLTDCITAAEARPVLEDENCIAELRELVPESLRNDSEVVATLSSPQFQQALRGLTSALNSESYNAVLANFGLDPAAGVDALTRGNAILAFCQAVQALADSERTDDSTGED